jgi:RNA:NAD 2'-phosphotransferase (TPT1/KptA family)
VHETARFVPHRIVESGIKPIDQKHTHCAAKLDAARLSPAGTELRAAALPKHCVSLPE